MKLELMPGYRDLFNEEPTLTYEQLLKNIPTENVLLILISLNAELNAPLAFAQNQKRLITILTKSFTDQQQKVWHLAFEGYKLRKKAHSYNGCLIGRPYLLSMILRELNFPREVKDFNAFEIGIEFNILLAYLLIVDEMTNAESARMKNVMGKIGEPMFETRLIWTSLINQYQLNDSVDPSFQVFKLMCFFKFASTQYQSECREYLSKLGFATPGAFMKSLITVSSAMLDYRKGEVLTKLNFLRPVEGSDTSHLEFQSINAYLGKRTLKLDNIRKMPLYRNKKGNYMVIDQDIYNKRIFNGAFFELYKLTSLKNRLSFDEYSSKIGTEVLERLLFRSIVMRLSDHSRMEILRFDDGSDGHPDAYYRKNGNIIFFEFKGNIFPDNLVENPDFDILKDYLESRFVKNHDGKAKGISQLLQQVLFLAKKMNTFDKKLWQEKRKKLTIYPIICHHEFNLSMPGINDYLENRFRSMLNREIDDNISVKPLALINIEHLLNLSMRGQTFKELTQFLDRYFRILHKRGKQYNRDRELPTFLNSKSSFDEFYDKLISKELKPLSESTSEKETDSLFSSIEFSQSNLERVL